MPFNGAHLLKCYQYDTSLVFQGKFAEWQEAWGGLFVSALLCMSKKCLRVALFLSERKQEDMYSEIAESIGTILYSELMGSQLYGYPLSTMTNSQIRQKARIALSYFERAILSSAQNESNYDDSNVVYWEVKFMIGKVRYVYIQLLIHLPFHTNMYTLYNSFFLV